MLLSVSELLETYKAAVKACKKHIVPWLDFCKGLSRRIPKPKCVGVSWLWWKILTEPLDNSCTCTVNHSLVSPQKLRSV